MNQVQDKLEKMNGAESKAASARSSLDSRDHHHEQQAKSRPRAEDVYEILCNEALLPLDMTLAAARQYVWRQGGELIMHYRRRRLPVSPRPS